MQVSDQTFEPATRQRDSVERADEQRMERSRRRERCASRSVCLCELSVTCGGRLLTRRLGGKRVFRTETYDSWGTHLPTSKLGAAMGESSVIILKMPSNFLSGLGAVTEPEMRARALGSCQ